MVLFSVGELIVDMSGMVIMVKSVILQVVLFFKFLLEIDTAVESTAMVLFNAGEKKMMVKALHLLISKLGTVLSNTITTNQTPSQNISPCLGLLDYICDQQHSTKVVS